MLVVLYLAAIISANLIVTRFGPAASVVTAFLFIGLTITTRDRLHDRWGSHLRRNMTALIATGSCLSWLINRDAAQIAIASAVAFALSETVDAISYAMLGRRPWMLRSNGSNVLSSAVDSVVFPILAFGGILPAVMVGQFLAKVGGGLLWSLALRPKFGADITTRWSRGAFVVAALCMARPLAAQVASLDLGVIQTPYFREPVLEGFVASPPVGRFRVFGLVSHRFGDPQLSGQLQLSGRVLRYKAASLSVTAGAIALPYRDWHPDFTAGLQGLVFLPVRDWSLVAVYSRRPAFEGDYSALLKLSHTLWFVR